jgi:hypothetical protein
MTESLLQDLYDYQTKDPQQALDAAVAAVRSYCGWVIAPITTETVDVWSPDGRSLFLSTQGLTAIGSVVQDGVTLSSTGYLFDKYGVVRCVPGNTFRLTSRLTVTFTHGTDLFPENVQNVILGLAQRAINDTRGIIPSVTGGKSFAVESYGPQLTAADKEKLEPYAIPSGFA